MHCIKVEILAQKNRAQVIVVWKFYRITGYICIEIFFSLKESKYKGAYQKRLHFFNSALKAKYST